MRPISGCLGATVLFGQLECFLAVARLGNLSRAAEEMYLTQPTLTARLKALEGEVGDRLFVRTSRGMRLTDAGRELAPYAERAVSSFVEGKHRLEELRKASGGRLLLGASPGVGTYALPGLLVDPGHRFTSKGSADLAEIGEEQLIFFDHDSSYFEQTHALFRNAGIGELRTMEVDNIEAAKRMVEHRLGVAFLPRTAIVRAVAAGEPFLVPGSPKP